MKVDDILEAKGREVETVEPESTVLTAVHRLVSRGFGAVVVSSDGQRVLGMLNERDLVRGLLRHGGRLLDMRVSEVMSRDVPVCSPTSTIQDAMAQMTRTRCRHLPVLDGDRLCGLVSIGDVVKHRLDEMELETNVLRDVYIAGR